MNLPDKDLYELEAAMEQWTDNRLIHSDDLEDLLAFLLYLPAVLSQSGLKYHGFSCRQQNGATRLMLKASENGTPLVAFVTAPTTTHSIVRTLDLLLEDRIRWNRDKYPWI